MYLAFYTGFRDFGAPASGVPTASTGQYGGEGGGLCRFQGYPKLGGSFFGMIPCSSSSFGEWLA